MKKITRILLQTLFAIILLEILLRALYFQKNANAPLAFISAFKSISFRTTDNYKERLLNSHNAVRPDSISVNEKIVEEVIASNSFQYTPWVDYRNRDFSGKYVNNSGFIRKSVPDKVNTNKNDKPIKIFFFGGSTMFGFSSTDQETIASQFTKLYAEKCSGCPSIEVFNYGVPAYYSYNELILLSHLIFTNNKPDVAIFLDGLNDLYIIQAARNRLPWYYFRLRASSTGDYKNAQDSTYRLFHLLPGESIDNAINEAIGNYQSNTGNIDTLCKIYGIASFHFIQPNPYYNYTNRKNDKFADTSRNIIIEKGYPILEKISYNKENMFFLGNMLRDEHNAPFIDHIHYSPYMSGKIAATILTEYMSRMHN